MKNLLILLLPFVAWGQTDTLKSLFNSLGVEVGYFASQSLLTENATNYLNHINNNSDMVIVGTAFNDAISPSRGVYNFSVLDRDIAYWVARGKKIHLQDLLFRDVAPTWVRAISNTDTLTKIAIMWIDTVVKRCKGSVLSYEVCNEFNPRPSPLLVDTSVFWNRVPRIWKSAFVAARNADSAAILSIGENTFEDYNSMLKARYFIRLLDTMVANEVPFDEIRIQGHLRYESGMVYRMAGFTKTIGLLKKYNKSIVVSEFDCMIRTGLSDSLNSKGQNSMMSSFVQQCVNNGVKKFYFWDFSDSRSWIPEAFPGWGNACLWGAWNGTEFTKKAAYYAVVNALRNIQPVTHNRMKQIKIAINHTCIADTIDSLLYTINLHDVIKSQNAWDNFSNSGMSISVLNSQGSSIKKYLSGFNKQLRQGELSFAGTGSSNINRYVILDYADSTHVHPNDSSVFADGGVDVDLDLSSIDIKDKARNIVNGLDSIYSRTRLSVDTSEFGYAVTSSGYNNVRNRTSTNILRKSTGSFSVMFKALDSMRIGISQRITSIYQTSTNRLILCQSDSLVNAQFYIRYRPTTNFSVYDPDQRSVVDGVYRNTFVSWDSSGMDFYIDGKKKIRSDSIGLFNSTDPAYLTLFGGSVVTDSGTSFIGSVASMQVFKKPLTESTMSTYNNMNMDNASFFTASIPDTTPAITGINPSQAYLGGSFVNASGKTATVNGSSVTVVSQTDTSMVIPISPKGSNLADTIVVNDGSLSATKKAKYKYNRGKSIWGLK